MKLRRSWILLTESFMQPSRSGWFHTMFPLWTPITGDASPFPYSALPARISGWLPQLRRALRPDFIKPIKYNRLKTAPDSIEYFSFWQ